MEIPLIHIDAFTDKPFSGNPAAVFILPIPRGGSWMQDVAREMNLSASAFLLKKEDGFSLRWFTPKVELDICGHGTLASAHALWDSGLLYQHQEARFHTKSGVLTCQLCDGWIEMDFPIAKVSSAETPPGLVEALGVEPNYVGKARTRDYLVEVGSEATVRKLRPDFLSLEKVLARAVIVTSRSDTKDFDFVSRFFSLQIDIKEDPVTGSAHCALADYWARKLHRNELIAYQASERGGIVRLRVSDDRVFLRGKAVTVCRGNLA